MFSGFHAWGLLVLNFYPELIAVPGGEQISQISGCVIILTFIIPDANGSSRRGTLCARWPFLEVIFKSWLHFNPSLPSDQKMQKAPVKWGSVRVYLSVQHLCAHRLLKPWFFVLYWNATTNCSQGLMLLNQKRPSKAAVDRQTHLPWQDMEAKPSR